MFWVRVMIPCSAIFAGDNLMGQLVFLVYWYVMAMAFVGHD
jgi:hypothetical protein